MIRGIMDAPPSSRSAFASSFVPLQAGERAGITDYVRLGAWAACDAGGALLSSAGDPSLVAFLRSSAKPFQAIAFLRRGLHERLGLGDAEIACACASHEGEEQHVAGARRILASAEIPESALLCGTHSLSNKELGRRVARGELILGPIHNNCSGKHSAMLATCRHEGWPLETYTEPGHPLQVENLATLASFAGIPATSIGVGVDNCTVPTFALPLSAAARAFARLLDPRGLSADLAKAGRTAADAMRAFPDMVGGTGRLDTRLMQVTAGRVLVKTGANGFYAAAGSAPGSTSVMGFALKLAGAETEPQKAPACIRSLRAVGLLSDEETASLLASFELPQLDCRGRPVSTLRWIHEG